MIKMKKEICDECGKEIEEHYGARIFGQRWHLWGIIGRDIDGDFCSLKCLKKFVEKLK